MGRWRNRKRNVDKRKKNGEGTQFFGSTSEFADDTYKGHFLEDNYHGHGTYYDKSEDSKYVGDWKNGRPNGNGKVTFGSKSKYPNRYYEGDWQDGQMHGFGTKFWGQTENPEHINNKYIGEWRNDNMHGNGKYEWTDGSYYEGPWENGEQH